MKSSQLLSGSIALGLVLTVSAAAADSLESGFQTPPDSAKPQTWWHWMNGNITKEGIHADLEAMKQIGLGGATIVNVDCEIPRGPVPFLSPEWREDFKYAVQEANRLGLELCVENCAGWSSSGGPWNTVTNAMQRLTASEVHVAGPTQFHEALPQPPVTLGYYRDVAVLAFKIPTPVKPLNKSGGAQGKLEIKKAVYEAEDGAAEADVKAKVLQFVNAGQFSIPVGNGEMGGDPAFGHVKQLRVDFTIDGKPGTATAEEGETLTFPANADDMAHIQSMIRTSARQTFVSPTLNGTPAGGPVIQHDEVVDLTSKMSADGHLTWDVPAGNWAILRLGYTPTGVNNHPAPKEGEGLECDKFSKAALDAHWDGFMQKVLDDIGPLAGKALNTSLIDSYEVGPQDWTEAFRAEFQRRRGYDPLKFLPTFTGRVVDSPEVTERFLWDMRRTIADLFADNYFGHFAELCRQHGLKNAVEPYTGPFESLQCGAPADVVMGEFWTGSQGHPSVKMAASIAHIYGKTIVGAESFTAAPDAGRWQNDPYALKALGDLMFCDGLNRYIFHRYAMQPWTNRWPGMTMGQWGFHFERTETWWHQGKAWIDYISRCEFLLQQGRAVADVAYFTGESAPVEMRLGNPKMPAGYDYDAINADVLLHGATVKNGRITLPSGASYAALVLPPNDINMTPPMMRCVRDLVQAGATVIGPRPEHSPSLENFPQSDAQVKTMAAELWGKCDGKNVRENACGRGRVVWGQSLEEIFATQNLKPDFEFHSGDTHSRLAYTHRMTGDADIYFVSNQRHQFDSAQCTFRVTGKVPELWYPDTGEMKPAPVWSAKDGRTAVSLDFDPAGSVFVVFRQAANVADHFVSAHGQFDAQLADAGKLEIKHAIYGAVNTAGGMDVTTKLADLVAGGRRHIAANNEVFGRDPVPDSRKELRVDYVFNGQPAHVVVHENETLALPGTALSEAVSPYDISVSAKGAPEVTVWNNGKIELTRASGKTWQTDVTDLPAPQAVSGAWNLSFPPNWGAPAEVTLDKLISWPDHPDKGVRYFSGTATYTKDIKISAGQLAAGRELWLNLGLVKNFAEVSLNGHDFGVLWKPPFRVNLTGVAKPGTNRLVIKVTNLWPNRLIGDEQLPSDREWNGKQLKAWPQWVLEGKPSPTGRFTFTTWHHWTKNSPLLESGLIGPVTLNAAKIIPVD